jgi:hypothetical protein
MFCFVRLAAFPNVQRQGVLSPQPPKPPQQQHRTRRIMMIQQQLLFPFPQNMIYPFLRANVTFMPRPRAADVPGT